MAKLRDEEILAMVRQESWQAQSYITSEVSDARETAMERYLGLPYNDEVEGKSQVVMRDVLETVEWVMPSLLRIFVSGDDIISYEPEGPEDEQFAAQATDLANVAFYKDNNGFLILNTWFKDALLQKMGVVKSYWDERECTSKKTYTDLNIMEFIQVTSPDNVEVIEHTEKTLNGEEYVEDEEAEEMGLRPDTVHDVTVLVTKSRERVKIENIPPEEFRMSYDAADPDEAKFLEHVVEKSRSDLIADGFDRKLVEMLPASSDTDEDGEKQARYGVSTEGRDERSDPMMEEVEVHESYFYADCDGDGIAEWTRVLWSGSTVLERDQVDSQPFSTICPIPIPHRAYGLSLADLIVDLTRIRTVIMRQTLDNLYLSNNPEREVDVNSIVDMDDFLTSRAGGIKRVEKIGASREISHPFVAQHSFAMLDGLDAMETKRTGVSDMAMAVDAEVLQNQTATASNNGMAVKNQRVEMIARIFAETGVKHLFRRVLNLLVENQTEERVIRLRNEWVPMNTNGWNPEMDVSINVGLGHGSRDQQLTFLNGLLAIQKELASSPMMRMVRPKHVYNTLEQMTQAIGYKNPDKFFDDPGDEPIQMPEQPDPQQNLIQAQMQIEQLKAQVNMQKAQLDAQAMDQKTRLAHHEAMQKLELESERIEVEREKIAASMNEVAAKIRSDEAKAAKELDLKAQQVISDKNEKERDRELQAMEKERDRQTQLEAARAKGQRNVSVTRGPDGSLQGAID